MIAALPTGPGGAEEIWKLNHYYDQCVTDMAPLDPVAGPLFELHNLSTDPDERRNRADGAADVLDQLLTLLVAERQSKRHRPRHGLAGPGAACRSPRRDGDSIAGITCTSRSVTLRITHRGGEFFLLAFFSLLLELCGVHQGDIAFETIPQILFLV